MAGAFNNIHPPEKTMTRKRYGRSVLLGPLLDWLLVNWSLSLYLVEWIILDSDETAWIL